MSDEPKASTALTLAFKKSRAAIMAVIPKHLDAERVLQSAYQAVLRDPKLYACDHVSLIRSVTYAAALGLEIGGPGGEAYLVPFKDQITLIPGYRGLCKLAIQSGKVLHLDARVVYRCDGFDVQYGDGEHLTHRPKVEPSEEEQADDQIIGAYSVTRLVGLDRPLYEWVPRWQIIKRRDGSRGYKDRNGRIITDSPWHQWFPEQARKTAIRIAAKSLPMATELQHAIELENRFDTGERTATLPFETVEEVQAEISAKTTERAHAMKEQLSREEAKAAARAGTSERSRLEAALRVAREAGDDKTIEELSERLEALRDE